MTTLYLVFEGGEIGRMLHEIGDNISICTYNGTLDVDRQIRLDEICGNNGTKTVTVTETHVNVLECENVSLATTGKLIPPFVQTGNANPYHKEEKPAQTSPDHAAGKPREDVQGNSDLGRFSNFSVVASDWWRRSGQKRHLVTLI